MKSQALKKPSAALKAKEISKMRRVKKKWVLITSVVISSAEPTSDKPKCSSYVLHRSLDGDHPWKSFCQTKQPSGKSWRDPAPCRLGPSRPSRWLGWYQLWGSKHLDEMGCEWCSNSSTASSSSSFVDAAVELPLLLDTVGIAIAAPEEVSAVALLLLATPLGDCLGPAAAGFAPLALVCSERSCS